MLSRHNRQKIIEEKRYDRIIDDIENTDRLGFEHAYQNLLYSEDFIRYISENGSSFLINKLIREWIMHACVSWKEIVRLLDILLEGVVKEKS